MIDICCPVAVTNLGRTWSESWQRLMQGERRFLSPREFRDDWPAGPPIARIGEGWVDENDILRSRAIVREVIRQLYEIMPARDLIEGARSISVIVATSHGEPNPVLAIATALHEGTTVRDDRVWRALLAEESGRLGRIGVDGLSNASVLTASAACASGVYGLAIAMQRIESGIDDVCVVVSVDSLSRTAYNGFRQIGAMSLEGCRPFDASRDGTTIGEAGTGWICVPHQASQDVHATVRSVALGCDARHPVEPSAEGLRSAILEAVRTGRLRSHSQLAGVIWHGSGTVQNDKVEMEVGNTLWGDSGVDCASIKGAFGHTMGASSGLGILCAAQALRDGRLPPAVGLRDQCRGALRFSPGTPTELREGPLLTVALGFGGINGAVVIDAPPRSRMV